MYTKLREADHLIVASPIFFLSVTAQTKTMIDRCQALWAAKYVLHRPISSKTGRRGLFLSAGHWTGPNNFRCAISVIRAFFVTIDVKYAGDVLIAGVEKKAEILKHPTACRQAFDAGAKLVTGPTGAQA